MQLRIAMTDLKSEWTTTADETMPAIARACASGTLVLGPEVEAFEREFAEACGARAAVGVACGADALRLGLEAMGAGPGREIILPANAPPATALAVVLAGAAPILADVEPDTGALDAEEARRRLSRRTRAVLVVHRDGQPADLAALSVLGVPLVEDAGQAHGALCQGHPVGAQGFFGAFGFPPHGNLGAAGDAGILLTANEPLAAAVRARRDLGREDRQLIYIGADSGFDDVQAAILRIRLRGLEDANRRRRDAARRYDAMLAPLPLLLPPEIPDRAHVFQSYVVRTPLRDALRDELSAAGIETGLPDLPVHLHPAFSFFGHARGDFPAAEERAQTGLALPMHPHLREEDQRRVADAIGRFCRRVVGYAASA